MLRPDLESQLIDRLGRKRKARRFKQWLTILLLGSLALITSFEPLITFSSYVVNLSNSFTLSTSKFYLTPSLELNQVTVDMAEGFSEVNNFTVANNDGTRITTHTSAYTITLEEDRETLLFDLYTDDGAGGKTICLNNTISGTLMGGSAATTSYALYFKIKDPATPVASYPVRIKMTSSEPYIRTYSFTVNITLDSSMILIPGTEDIYRPDVEIPEGEIMVFKDNEYEFLTVDDLLVPVVIDEVVIDLSRPDLIGGSLYVPATIGDILVESGQTIDWDVAGSIVMEPDIVVNNGNIEVNMVSHNGDIIMNQTTITGTAPKNEPFIVNITAENGGIEASGTIIDSKADGAGIISLVAKDDINISATQIASDGDYGVNIHSEEGNINAGNAVIISNNGTADATVIISAAGQINLDNATVQSKSSSIPPIPALLIESTNMGISARNATLTSTSNGKLLEIRSRELLDLDQATISSNGNLIITASGNIQAISTKMTATAYNNKIDIISSAGQIDLSSSTTAGIPITDITASQGNINIKSYQDTFIKSAKITASTNWGMKLQFESTGTDRKLWVQDANLAGNSIKAFNIEITGTTANGTITIGQ